MSSLRKHYISTLKGFIILAICYYTGKYLSGFTGNMLSGSIIGMLLLFSLLCMGIVKKEYVQQAAEFFLENFILFFIPALVAITLIDFAPLWRELPALILIAIITTLLVMVATGLFVQWRERNPPHINSSNSN